MTCPHCNRTWLSSEFIRCQKCGHDMKPKRHMEAARRVFPEVREETKLEPELCFPIVDPSVFDIKRWYRETPAVLKSCSSRADISLLQEYFRSGRYKRLKNLRTFYDEPSAFGNIEPRPGYRKCPPHP